MKLYGIHFFLLSLGILPVTGLFAQKTVKGHVFQDKYRTPLDSVTVHTQSGFLGRTDSSGGYEIKIMAKDSIWFQFRDKITHKYPVDTIKNPRDFEVQIFLPQNYAQTPKGYLPTVTVRARNYYQDSTAFREDYAKIFNYQKPSEALGESFGVGDDGGLAVDLDAVVNLFRFGYNRRQKVYQKFALSVEQEKYINHRFTKKLVEDITGLTDTAQQKYMELYKPTYEKLLRLNDVQLGEYIKITYQKFIDKKSTNKYEQNIFLSPYEQRGQGKNREN